MMEQWDDGPSPVFSLDPKCISVLFGPKEFHKTLVSLASAAQRRVVIASLYIGDDDLTCEVLSAIETAAKRAERPLEIRLLLDYNRSLRSTAKQRKAAKRHEERLRVAEVDASGAPSLEALRPLLKKKNVHVSLLGVPAGSRWWIRQIARRLPYKAQEVLGVMHWKIYVVDDTCILTGANCSREYFSVREDRYYAIENKLVCDSLHRLVQGIQEKAAESKMLRQDDMSTNDCSAGKIPLRSAILSVLRRVEECDHSLTYSETPPLQTSSMKTLSMETSSVKTLSMDSSPLAHQGLARLTLMVQCGQLGLQKEKRMLRRVVNILGPPAIIASSYLSVPLCYLPMFSAAGVILTSAPEQNSFYKARGWRSMIPWAYNSALLRFVRAMHENKKSEDNLPEIREFCRSEQSFHAKGLWWFPAGKNGHATVIGSSNIGYRSLHRDLELTFLLEMPPAIQSSPLSIPTSDSDGHEPIACVSSCSPIASTDRRSILRAETNRLISLCTRNVSLDLLLARHYARPLATLYKMVPGIMSLL